MDEFIDFDFKRLEMRIYFGDFVVHVSKAEDYPNDVYIFEWLLKCDNSRYKQERRTDLRSACYCLSDCFGGWSNCDLALKIATDFLFKM